MSRDILQRKTLIDLQGDKVMVQGKHASETVEEHVLTFVHVVDVDRRELRLVKREGKLHQPDWQVSQSMLDALKPAPENKDGAKWQLIFDL
jgi:hypothetical protein